MGRLNLRAVLTRRESEIAELLAWGAAKKEVADQLQISPRTVENTARHIYEKIGIQKATELCVYWFCSRCGVDPSLDPLKRAFIALALLIVFLPYDYANATTPSVTHDLQAARAVRAPRAARTARTGRTRCRRIEDSLFNPSEF